MNEGYINGLREEMEAEQMEIYREYDQREAHKAERKAQEQDARYQAWMAEVDAICSKISGTSVYDLSDQPFKDWWLEGWDAGDAAEATLEDNGW